MENIRRLAEVQAVLADPTAAILAALELPRICPRLDRAVATVVQGLTGDDVPVWCDGPYGGEVLQIEFPRQGEDARSVVYCRYPRPEGGYRYAVDIIRDTWGEQDLRSELRPNVKTDDQFGEAVWPLPY